MKVFGIRCGAFMGAVWWEWYIGRLWGRVLPPSRWFDKHNIWTDYANFGWDGEDHDD
jgi:hypothetical protein